MKNININVTEEEFKTIMVSIIVSQERIKRMIQRAKEPVFDEWLVEKKNDLEELDKLFNKLLIYVDEVSEKNEIQLYN